VKILGISGSLQQHSTNTALIEIARERAPDGVEVLLFDALAHIPPCNPDLDPAPAEVEAFRALVQSADGLLIATPEYAHGLPGTLKNALDWLVGSGELYGKRVVVVSAAPSSERAAHARADLGRTLRAQGAEVLASSTIAVPTRAHGHEIDDPEIVASVDAALAALIPAP
jgi:NAD(P)H-dependent FMN reductase